MRSILLTVLAGALTVAYWYAFVTVSFVVVAPNRRPGAARVSDAAVTVQWVATIAVAVLVYALLALGWWRLLHRRR